MHSSNLIDLPPLLSSCYIRSLPAVEISACSGHDPDPLPQSSPFASCFEMPTMTYFSAAHGDSYWTWKFCSRPVLTQWLFRCFPSFLIVALRLHHGFLSILLLLLCSSALSHTITPPGPLPQTPILASTEGPLLAPIPSGRIPHFALEVDGQDSKDETGIAPSSPPPVSSTDVAISNNSAAIGMVQQMTRKTRAVIALLSSLIAYISINSLVRALHPTAFIWYEEDHDEPRWIASSRSWIDRKACRFLGFCGAAHFRPVRARFGHRKPGADQPSQEEAPWRAFWTSGSENPDEWDDAERARREIPDYVFEYAPLVHLFSGEQFWPCDIAEHLYHTTPMLNYTPIQSRSDHPTLSDLDQLNQLQDGRYVFLTSNDNVEDRPPWMEGEKNIPESGEDDVEESWADWDGRVDGAIPGDNAVERAKWADAGRDVKQPNEDSDLVNQMDGALPLELEEEMKEELRKRYGGKNIQGDIESGGRSDAPAVLLVSDKGNGIVDAFWFYFYSFNLGNVVFNVRFGNHVGDWEHCLVRFYNGKPKALFFSAHSGGEAYSYEAVEKIGQRPVIYSAIGTHAMYATPGIHSYILPWGLLHDQTDRGPLWDPLLNSHAYTYDYLNETLRASTFSPLAPTEWFYFNGHWGDKFYPLGDHRQYRFAGQYHYVNGPLGPHFKHLDRRKVCQGPDESPCVIKDWIGESKRAKRWTASFEVDEDMSPTAAIVSKEGYN